MKKIFVNLALALFVTLTTIGMVLAGASLDRGQLETVPPVGEVNYSAWIGTRLNPNGSPLEIMTEDSYNSSGGPDLGYALQSIGIGWRIQVRNFYPYPPTGAPINMLFGGLGNSSGKYWNYVFNWNDGESITTHPITPLSTDSGEACPVIVETMNEATYKEVDFLGVANSKYHVYRSQLSSGSDPDNGLSNGRYQYLQSVFTDGAGAGTFIDPTTERSWYIVIKADPNTNTPIGCHSEEAFPTAVTVSGFEAAYLPETPAIQLTWETASEVDLMSFRVLRSASVSGDKVALAQLAVQNPGSLVGGSYAYQDENVLFGQTYFYWLEMIHLDGSRDLLGPLQQTVGYLVYLPLSWR